MAVDTSEVQAQPAPSETHSESGLIERLTDFIKSKTATSQISDAPGEQPAPSTPTPTQSETRPSSPPAAEAPPAARTQAPEPPQPYKVYHSAEDERRALQSFYDQESTRRQRAEQERKADEIEAKIRALPDEYTPGPDGLNAGQLGRMLADVRAGVRAEESRAQIEREMYAKVEAETVGPRISQVDQVTVHHLLGKLPPAESQRILADFGKQNIEDGLEQRRWLMDAALDAHAKLTEKTAYDLAYADLMKHGNVVKQAAALLREETEEPDNVTGTSGGNGTMTQELFDQNRRLPSGALNRAWIKANKVALDQALAAGVLTH